MKTLSSKTSHPNIFKDTYWSGFSSEKHKLNSAIFENRDNFVDDYNIISYVNKKRPHNVYKLFDHCELYKSRDGFVYVTSPYEDASTEADEYDFTEYSQLYNMKAKTYVREFESKVEFNKFLRELNQ